LVDRAGWEHPIDDAAIVYAARLLRAGGVVALPTETVYGLAADAENEKAVRRVYAIKGRPFAHPLIVHVADPHDIDHFARNIPAGARTLAERFWPGPLTLILEKRGHVTDLVTGGQDTVALRIVDHPKTRMILRSFGGAVAMPSANRFGRVSPTTAQHVRDDLGDDVDLIVDGGPSFIGVESTIVDMTSPVPAIVRAGAIGPTELAAALGIPVVTRSDGSVRAPGTLPSHYAPRTPLVLAEPDEAAATVARLAATGKRVGMLTFPDDPYAAARTLYGSVRALDTQQYDVVVVELPIDVEANAAVRDRLTRAAAPRPGR
jgi:L-threonylcarbamoyladenylate synthase